MGIFDFFKRSKDSKSISKDSLLESENKSSSRSKTYIELEEFLYLANKLVINNQAANDSAHIRAFITDDINETELNVIKEEIKYFMFCILNFYTYAEVTINKKILDLNNEKAQNHFLKTTYFSLERSFLTSFGDFDYTIEKYKNRYAKYTQYLGKYHYQDIERSFLECFAAQLSGGFEDNPIPLNVDITQLLLTARWVYRTYGETTKLTLSNQNFII